MHAHSHTHAHTYVAAEVCKPFGFMANDMVITPLGVEITIIGVKMPPAREPPPGDPDADADAEQDEEGEHAEGAEPRGNGVVCCVSSLLACIFAREPSTLPTSWYKGEGAVVPQYEAH